MHSSQIIGTLLTLGGCTSRTSVFALVQLSGETASAIFSSRRTLRLPSFRRRRIEAASPAAAATAAVNFIGRVHSLPSATSTSARGMLALALPSRYSSYGDGRPEPPRWISRRDRIPPSRLGATSVGGAGAAGAAAFVANLASSSDSHRHKASVIFVLGGPGSGKGTQCSRLAEEFGYVHLSAGELLRRERESGSSDGQLIDEYIREGRIVPVSISLGLLRKAMDARKPFSRFLIDGFPRNSDNVQGWDENMGDVAKVRRVLFLHCPEDVLEERLLTRGKSSGRTDDNAETAKRRFRTYVETTLPVVEDYERRGLVTRVNGNQDVQAVFRDVREGLRPVQEEEVLDAHRVAAEATSEGGWSSLDELCAADMTEIVGADAGRNDGRDTGHRGETSISRRHVRMLKGDAAVISCERPCAQGDSQRYSPIRETTVWQVLDGRWTCVHRHAS